MSKGGRFAKKKIWNGRKIALVIACVIALSVLGTVAFATTYVNSMLNDVNHVEVAEIEYTQPAVAEEPAVVVAELSAGEGKVEETTEAAEVTEATKAAVISKPEDFQNFLIVCKPVKKDGTVKQTDTMILCTLNKRTKTMTMTSLLGNALVETPAYKRYSGGEATLNTVYGLGAKYGNATAGSMELMNQTLYNNFGLEIDENFELDLNTLARVITRLEYIKIELTEAEAKYLSEATGKEIKAGEQEMDGTLAKEYIQMWADEETESADALSGQKKLFNGILQKIRTQYIADLEPLVKEFMPAVTTSMSWIEFREFLVTMLPLVRSLSIESGGTFPVEYEAQMKDVDGNGTEEEVLTFDAAQATKAMRALSKGEK